MKEKLRLGRPGLSQKGGKSPMLFARVTQNQKEKFEEIARMKEKKPSVLLRELIEKFLKE